MHLIKDENGNLVQHGHEHTEGHTHEHTHADGVTHTHSHSHGDGEHAHTHEGGCADQSHCGSCEGGDSITSIMQQNSIRWQTTWRRWILQAQPERSEKLWQISRRVICAWDLP